MSTTKPTILLVHGAFHGSWCWKFQIPALEALSYTTETVDLPSASGIVGKTQLDDAACVRSAVESLLTQGKRVVVLAHSYGGPIASSAVTGLPSQSNSSGGGKLLGMIGLCAHIFPGGQDQGEYIRSMPERFPYFVWDTPAEGFVVMKDPRSMFLTPDVSDELVEWALPQLRPQSMAAMLGSVPAPQAWQDEGYTGQLGFIRCTGDGGHSLTRQDQMLEAGGGREKWVIRTIEGAGHSPFLSRPGGVAATVDEIVNEFEAEL